MQPMPAPVLMIAAAALFALMGACVKLASSHYDTGEVVMYRSLIGMALMAGLLRVRGIRLRTRVPALHFWRSSTGVCAMMLWFYAISGLPLATATTLNYMSSVWLALFVIGGSALAVQGRPSVDGRLVAAVLTGFVGVALVLRPTFERQHAWFGFIGLLSGILAALAYLQVRTLGRAGEPEERVVFYFSLGGVIAGAAVALASGGMHRHTAGGLALLLAIGVLATAAQWLLTRAYARGATLGNAALNYLGIVFAFVLGVWWFDDPVSWRALAGMVLIVGAGLAATMLRPAATTLSPDAAPTQY
jgi:drug/metabolite transporter (DMT)-like permease